MRILLSNDDGVHAPGLQCLLKTLKTWADVTVVAPLSERSTTGHTLTLDHPLRLVEIEPQVYGCDGYPALPIKSFGHLTELPGSNPHHSVVEPGIVLDLLAQVV